MIKRTPQDFQVEEILDEKFRGLATPEPPAKPEGETGEPNSTGCYALYRLRKESLATPEAVGRIARRLGVPSGALAYGGLKDKHASTIQYATLKLETPRAGTPPDESEALAPPDVSGAAKGLGAVEELSGPGWSLERVGFVPRPIAASDIHRNRFQIVLRNLSARDCADMDEALALLSSAGTEAGPTVVSLRIVNYFGDQRFGSARHGRGFIGRCLAKGDFEGALKLAIATESRKDRMDDKIFKRTLRENWGRWREVLPRLRPCAERRAVERLAQSSGDFRSAFCALPYLLQQLSVYAYQSHLWNAMARRVVIQFCVPQGKVMAAEDPFGEMLFPAAAAIPPELANLDIPLLAHKTVLAEPWKQAAEETLRAEGLEVSELRIQGVRRPFFGEEPRALFVEAERLALSAPAADETAKDTRRLKRELKFDLPRGCYATVLLKALAQ